MKGRYGFALLTIVGLLALLPAIQADPPDKPTEPAKVVDPNSLPEVQDVIFFTEKRPVLLRMRLYVDGKPANERWEAFQKTLFEYLDTDHDGFLDVLEAQRIPPHYQLSQLFAGNPNFNGQLIVPAFKEIDTDNDGKISPAELVAYYRRNNAGPFDVVTGAGLGNTADQLTNALFGALDVNKDGKLSREELLAADKLLLKFDDNDDEILTPQEILATAINPYAPPPQQRGGGLPVKSGVTSILLVPKDEDKHAPIEERLKVAKEVLARYDKDKDGKLSREELGFPKEVFDELDKKDRGKIEALELLRWVIATPDLECTVRLGQVDSKVKFIEPNEDSKTRSGLHLNATSQTTLSLDLEHSDVSVVRGGVQRVGQGARSSSNTSRRIFQTLDTDKKGFLTLKQLEGRGPPGLKPFLDFVVRADEGRVTEKELEAFFAMTSAAMSAQIVVTFNDNGQGLFDMLDSNGDGQLSIREMRNGWNRLAVHMHDGFLTKNDIPRQYALIVGRMPNPNGRAQFVDVGGGRMAPTPRGPAAQRGPLWFRKMDVNGDGDVSEREFLGSKEDFRRINVSGDGLISVEEAEKADAWFREKMQQK